MKMLILGFVLAFVALALAAYSYVRLGFAPVATSSEPLPFERTIAGTALRAAVAREAPKDSPIAADEGNLLAGARIYRETCAVCHGLPGQPKTAIAQGMYPPPPQMFHGKGVSDDPVGVTYWKVMNGIRLTGMPGFRDSLSEQQCWQVSELLRNSQSLPANVRDVLQEANPQK